MNNVQISSDDVLQYANQLSMMEQEILQIFQEIKSKMNYVETVWSSPASKNLMGQFQQMYPVFDRYVQALGEYALYLNQTASSYAENEQALTAAMSTNG